MLAVELWLTLPISTHIFTKILLETNMRFESLIIVFFFSGTSLLGQKLDNFADSTRAWNLHYQFTMVEQYHPAFHALYDGPHSLSDTGESAMTVTSTIFAGSRLWPGCSAFCNPEIAGGKGLSSAYGVAGFPNGESFRVSDPAPTLTMARFFIRQRINLNTDKMDTLADDANQVWEKTSSTAITITMGKIALTDIFDNNRYSHDPRTQFLNWSLMDGGAWDFPADTRGYTYAFVVEYNLPQFSFRGAISAVPT
jgi:high affinity Mn2+ porin